MSKDAPDILFFPPALSVAAPIAAAALEWFFDLRLLQPPGGRLTSLGIVLILLAGGLAISGTRAFRKSETNIDPRQPALVLVRTGPYQFTRNPMYLGMITLNLGLTFVFLLNWGLFTTPLLALALHFGVVLREEAYLTDKFGTPYSDYLKQTRRWL